MKYASVLLAVTCLLSAVKAQYWNGPFQVTSDTFDDINPSTFKEWIYDATPCLVWQTNRAGNWDIYSMFHGYGGDMVVAVCRDSADDVNPVVACSNETLGHSWCVWEQRESPVAGRICASFSPQPDSWESPVQIGRCLHDAGDSSQPSVIAIGGESADTTWIVWTNHDTSGWYVEYSFNAGDSWTTPMIAIAQASPILHARLGRRDRGSYHGCPLLVWETNGDIFRTEYVGGSWTIPHGITHSPALDRNPEVLSLSFTFSGPLGPAIVWESTQDGDTAIFGTTDDSLVQFGRWCDSSGAGNNWTPCGTPSLYPCCAPPVWVLPVWVSDRGGNRDIYARLESGEDGYVDNDPADDINPTLTTQGLTRNVCWWQSNRSGNWDIWYSYFYVNGMEEKRHPSTRARQLGPTVVRGVLFLAEATSLKPQAASLLDIAGREVLELQTGPNDVRALAPGVYFVRLGQTSPATKIVVHR